MNKKFLKMLVLFCSTSVLFMAGCGPQDMIDSQDGIANENKGYVLNKDAQETEESAQPEAQPPQNPAPEGAPAGSPADGGCPTGTCEIPPDPGSARSVQIPDTVTSEPVKIVPTGENQSATDIVDHYKTHHVYQPTERHHTVNKHRELLNRYFTKIIYHPTFRRINRIVRTGSASSQVMPTEEVTEPVVDFGCAGTVEAMPAPVPAMPVYPIGRYGHRPHSRALGYRF